MDFYKSMCGFSHENTGAFPHAVIEIRRRFSQMEWIILVDAIEVCANRGMREPFRLLNVAAHSLETDTVYGSSGPHMPNPQRVYVGAKLRQLMQDQPQLTDAFAAYYSANTPPTDHEIRNARWEQKRRTAASWMRCAEWQRSTLIKLGYEGAWPNTVAEANALIGALVAAKKGSDHE